MNLADKISTKISFGDIIEDYGVFSKEEYLASKQELSLFKVRNKQNEEFFVVKCYITTRSLPWFVGGFTVNYLKLSEESLRSLNSTITNKIVNT